MIHFFKRFCGLIFLSLTVLVFAAPQSADSLIAEAEKGKKDILIYYHGSDWTPIGETLLKTLWQDPKLQKILSENYVTAQCDIREQQGVADHAAFQAIAHNDQKGVETLFDTPIASSGAEFTIKNQNLFLVSGRNAKNDRYTISFTPKKSIQSPVFRIRLLENPSLPSGGPSRSPEGKCALSYATLVSETMENIPFVDAIADITYKDKVANYVLKDYKDKEKFWGFENKDRRNGATLYLVAGAPLKENETYQLTFYFNSQWTSSAFGCFKIDLFDAPKVCENIANVTDYYTQVAAMAPFRDVNEGFPLIRAYDKDKRELGSMTCLTDKTTADQVTDYFDKVSKARIARDRYFDRAGTQKEVDKAQSLASAILAFDTILSYDQLRRIYKPQYEEIRRLDPDDTCAYQRKLDLPYHAIVSKIKEMVGQEAYQQAEAYYQTQLNDPKNYRLTKEQKQRLTFAGFYLYKRWKGKEEKMWRLLDAVVAIDPNSHIGLGARGYLSMNGQGEIALPYGIFPKDFFNNALDARITMGVGKIINHKGTYELIFEYKKGKDTFDIQQVSILINGKSCFSDNLAFSLNNENKIKKYAFEVPFNVMTKDHIEILLKARTPNGSDCYVGINIKPTLE